MNRISLLKNKAQLHEVGWSILVVTIVGTLLTMAYLISTTDRYAEPQHTNSQADTRAGQESNSLETPGLEIDPEVLRSLEATELATLESVRDVEESGVASRLFLDDTYQLEVIVLSPPPALGTFYEVWLVNSDGFMSVGELVPDNDEEGIYALSYSSSKNLNNYSKVVVTQETSANSFDNIPELHTVEGEFAQE